MKLTIKLPIKNHVSKLKKKKKKFNASLLNILTICFQIDSHPIICSYIAFPKACSTDYKHSNNAFYLLKNFRIKSGALFFILAFMQKNTLPG